MSTRSSTEPTSSWRQVAASVAPSIAPPAPSSPVLARRSPLVLPATPASRPGFACPPSSLCTPSARSGTAGAPGSRSCSPAPTGQRYAWPMRGACRGWRSRRSAPASTATPCRPRPILRCSRSGRPQERLHGRGRRVRLLQSGSPGRLSHAESRPSRRRSWRARGCAGISYCSLMSMQARCLVLDVVGSSRRRNSGAARGTSLSSSSTCTRCSNPGETEAGGLSTTCPLFQALQSSSA